jgi:hypothetical protein
LIPFLVAKSQWPFASKISGNHKDKGDSGMSRYTNILTISVAAALLLLGGTFRQSAVDPLHRSFQGFSHSFLGSIHAPFSSLSNYKSMLIAAADKESEDSTGDKKDSKDGKDEEDGGLKELWDSVLLG